MQWILKNPTHLLFVKGLPEGTEWENSVSFMLVTGLGGLERKQKVKKCLVCKQQGMK